MPGILHQGVLSLFCLDPWLPFDLLGRERPGSGPLRDRRAEVEAPVLASSKLTVGLPDLVLASDLPAHEGGLVVCVEAQLDAVRVGIEATRKLSRPHQLRYLRTLLAAVPERLRHIIEKELSVEEYDPLWEIECKSSPYVYGVREGLEKGRAEGRAEGRTALLQLIIELLDSRGISPDENTQSRLAACEDLDLLRTWAKRAGSVRDASELFADS